MHQSFSLSVSLFASQQLLHCQFVSTDIRFKIYNIVHIVCAHICRQAFQMIPSVAFIRLTSGLWPYCPRAVLSVCFTCSRFRSTYWLIFPPWCSFPFQSFVTKDHNNSPTVVKFLCAGVHRTTCTKRFVVAMDQKVFQLECEFIVAAEDEVKWVMPFRTTLV